MSTIKEEFEKSFEDKWVSKDIDRHFVKDEAEPYETALWAAKWMAEYLEREFNPNPALTGKKSHVSQRIAELAKELS